MKRRLRYTGSLTVWRSPVVIRPICCVYAKIYKKFVSIKIICKFVSENETKKYYVATTTIALKTGKIDKIKDLVAASLSNGVTNVDSIYYDVQNKEKYYLDLKKAALKKAKEEADYILAGAGAKTGKLMAFEFSAYNVMSPQVMMVAGKMDVSEDKASPSITPIDILPPKDIPITQTVQAIFEIK